MKSFLSRGLSAVLTFFLCVLTGWLSVLGVGSHVDTDAGLKMTMMTGSVRTRRLDACALLRAPLLVLCVHAETPKVSLSHCLSD